MDRVEEHRLENDRHVDELSGGPLVSRGRAGGGHRRACRSRGTNSQTRRLAWRSCCTARSNFAHGQNRAEHIGQDSGSSGDGRCAVRSLIASASRPAGLSAATSTATTSRMSPATTSFHRNGSAGHIPFREERNYAIPQLVLADFSDVHPDTKLAGIPARQHPRTCLPVDVDEEVLVNQLA